jgi:hypothetical protein
MVHLVICRSSTAEAWVLTRVSPCAICGGQSVIGQVSLRFLRLSPVSIIPPSFSVLICIIRGMNNVSVSGGSSET